MSGLEAMHGFSEICDPPTTTSMFQMLTTKATIDILMGVLGVPTSKTVIALLY